MKEFSKDVQKKLEHYVYRLVDPRDEKTFYVGEGQGNRVFDHAKNAMKKLLSSKKQNDEDETSLKIEVIKEILAKGLEVTPIIHRWGIKDEKTAFEIEGALIDAYPELTNEVSGHGADRGVQNANVLNEELGASEFIKHKNDKFLIIKVRQSSIEAKGDRYEATRRAWVINTDNANNYKYIFSVTDGIVKEIYELTGKWIRDNINKDRYQFKGQVTEDKHMIDTYKNKKLPAPYFRAQGPVLYSK